MTTNIIRCPVPLLFEKDVLAFKSIKSCFRKYCLRVSVFEFLQYSNRKKLFNLYDVPTEYAEFTIISLQFDLTYSRDLFIYEMLYKLPLSKRKILMCNAIIHTGRKIMLVDNPTLDVFIVSFNKN